MKRPSIAYITKEISDYYNVGIRHLKSHIRTETMIRPRLMIYYICQKIFGYKSKQIAKYLNKNSSTIRHGSIRVGKWLVFDNLIAIELKQLRVLIGAVRV